MSRRTPLFVGLIFGFLVFPASWAKAQSVSRNPARQIFEQQTYRRPTVSPYLNLLREQGLGLPTYQTLVRPQLQQQRANQQQTRQIQQLQLEVAQNAASSQAGEVTLRPTGHQTAFRNFGHFYPRMPQPRR